MALPPVAAEAVANAPALTDELLTAGQAGHHLQSGERFARRPIAERRIPLIELGNHVRLRAVGARGARSGVPRGPWVTTTARPAKAPAVQYGPVHLLDHMRTEIDRAPRTGRRTSWTAPRPSACEGGEQ